MDDKHIINEVNLIQESLAALWLEMENHPIDMNVITLFLDVETVVDGLVEYVNSQ